MKQLKDFTNWQDMINEVVLGDCLEGMKMIPDQSIDLILTDPPYQIHAASGGGLHNTRNWLKNVHEAGIDTFSPTLFLEEIKRICKTFHAYIFTSKSLLKEYIDFFEQNGYKWELLLYFKSNPIPTKNNKYLSDKEYCFFVRDDNCYFNNYAPYTHYRTVKEYAVTPNKFHPTEKPIDFFRECLQMSSKNNELILDPFMGSWTTARACKDLGRRFIGFELEEKYCRVGEERLRQENLF